eukprot:CAMPEP_0180293622 /NCGR_PEP_ID=MMETSP0988-20121125/17622_1 /TAXON_ID=697907 /ORGANISM="non described non described, Strain CCMP2293" /LENGTH=51 /DNA_ID=CAMNT_0022270263 /DNA_START=115 /DNA_END=266 /DNA_ORIENTATION=+
MPLGLNPKPQSCWAQQDPTAPLRAPPPRTSPQPLHAACGAARGATSSIVSR